MTTLQQLQSSRSRWSKRNPRLLSTISQPTKNRLPSWMKAARHRQRRVRLPTTHTHTTCPTRHQQGMNQTSTARFATKSTHHPRRAERNQRLLRWPQPVVTSRNTKRRSTTTRRRSITVNDHTSPNAAVVRPNTVSRHPVYHSYSGSKDLCGHESPHRARSGSHRQRSSISFFLGASPITYSHLPKPPFAARTCSCLLRAPCHIERLCLCVCCLPC
jgi:hypothetical protein